MKKKYLFMLPAMSLAASTSAFAQDTAKQVPAAAKVNMKAEFSEAKPAKELYTELAEIITELAKKDDHDVDGEAILAALGLDTISSYAMSSEKDGNLWTNQLFIENGGSEKGLFALLGKKNAKFSVTELAPADSDLVFQMDLDLRTIEKLIEAVMTAANAPAQDLEDFKSTMSEKDEMLGMTPSEILAKMNLRVNFILDLDPTVKLALPYVGQIDTPNLLIRIDGAAWVMDKLGNDFVAQMGLPLEQNEVDGVTTFSLPPAMANQLLGYSPVITVDSNTDQITIATTSAFLAKCTGDGAKLSSSEDYIASTKGFSATEGNVMSYVSEDASKFLVNIMEIAKANGLLEDMTADDKAQLEKVFTQLKNVESGLFTSYAKTEDGLKMNEKGIQDIQTSIADSKKQFEALLDEM